MVDLWKIYKKTTDFYKNKAGSSILAVQNRVRISDKLENKKEKL